MAASLLFDYMAIHGIRDEYKAKRVKLTDNTITQLQTREELQQTELEQKLEEINNTLKEISNDRISLEASIVDNYHRKDIARLERLDNHGKNLLNTIRSGGGEAKSSPSGTNRAGMINLKSSRTAEEWVRLLWDDGKVVSGENLVPKSHLAKNAYERWDIVQIYKALSRGGAVVRTKQNDPYTAKVGMEEALQCIA